MKGLGDKKDLETVEEIFFFEKLVFENGNAMRNGDGGRERDKEG